MLSPGAKVVFCANLNATNVQIKHSVTALKFATKIREAIQKRMSKVGRRQSIDLETAFGRDVQDIENELTILKLMKSKKNPSKWDTNCASRPSSCMSTFVAPKSSKFSEFCRR